MRVEKKTPDLIFNRVTLLEKVEDQGRHIYFANSEKQIIQEQRK